MQVFFGIGRLGKARHSLKDVVAAIGVFDGVHLGHQEVIRRVVSQARRISGTSLVVTFHPHPVQVLHPERFSSYLTTLPQRLELIARLGIDACLVVPFTKRFAAMKPVDFVEKYLVKGLKVKKIVVGNDFHFGHDRSGTIRLLESRSRKEKFLIEAKKIKQKRNINIKSSFIRQELLKGEIDVAASLLGRPYSIRGQVVHGDKRGRRLGFPTANIRQENVIIPPSGIYAARVRACGKEHNALFYIGRRPSFKSPRARISLEAYILDYRKTLYGLTIDIELLKLIRPEMRFSDEESLVRQIRKDECCARKYFDLLSKK